MAVALELAMTGDPIDAERAYALGLVNRVVPADRLLAEAVALAERIAANAPLAVRHSKSVMKRAARGPRGRGLDDQRGVRRRRVLLGRRHGGAGGLCREARRRGGRASSDRCSRAAPGLDTLRLTLHVLAATVWVGGQIVMAGLVGPSRGLGGDAPKVLARAFARLAWPAFVVLVVTGFWNIATVNWSAQDRPGRPCWWPRSASWSLAGRRRRPPPTGQTKAPAGVVGVGGRPRQHRGAGMGILLAV